MKDYFYRFDDRAAMLAALEPLGMTYSDPEGTLAPSQGSHQYALWETGELTGYEGYHMNLRVIDETLDVSSLEAFQVFPQSPRVVWA